MSELREVAIKYTREYIRLRKETNQLLREGKIDKQEADHRNGNAKQFLLFAQFQIKSTRKTSGAKITTPVQSKTGEAPKRIGIRKSDDPMTHRLSGGKTEPIF
jgi:hypothetical protein